MRSFLLSETNLYSPNCQIPIELKVYFVSKTSPLTTNAPSNDAILIAFGANLPTDEYGAPAQTLKAALQRLAKDGDISIDLVSSFYETAPVPVSDQPWYVNGVARVRTRLSAHDLLDRLHMVEAEFGRVRRERNAARAIDLDLIAYGQELLREDGGIQVPHPRMAERAFVLLPLRDVAVGWRHPVLGRTVEELIADLPADQEIRKQPES
ncbi:MAG: 2-amino-4-hydroxy-6-hydroxymethyldihydropteridine diphosphokinase [Rhodospirillales bacterium]|nr:2-amino-4-hydroxy-6-hydroxymethyldihydropteridine diphosphokinase [Rhodospirillales bacterium]